MRVSDAEREAAAAELREHFASGRLTQDELDERLTAVFAAKTRGDLNAVFTDLPSSGHGWASASAPGGGRPSASWPSAPGLGLGPGSSGAERRTGRRAATPGGPRPGRSIGRIATASVLVWVLFIVGILGVFGIGTGRPFGVVLIIAALALLRRLLFMIFGAAPRARRPRPGRPAPPPLAGAVRPLASRPPGDKIAVRDLSWKGPNFRRKREVRWRCVTTLPFPVAAASRRGHGEDRTRCALGTRNATLRQRTLVSTTRLDG